MRKTRRILRGAGIGSSKMSCTSGECVETPGSAAPVSAVPEMNTPVSALELTNKSIESLRARSDELEAQIAQYHSNAITRRNAGNRPGGVAKLRLKKMAQNSHKTTLMQLRNMLLMKFKLLKESNQLNDDAKTTLRDLKMYIDDKLATYSQNTGIAGGYSRKGKRRARKTQRK